MRVIASFALAVVAAVPAADGSFLVSNLSNHRQPRPPLFTARQEIQPAAPTAQPRVRCPIQVVEADPKLDQKIAKPAPAEPVFTLRVEPPPCAVT